MSKHEQVTAIVVSPFMVGGEMAVAGDEVVLSRTDAQSLLHRGRIAMPDSFQEQEEEEEE